MIQLLLLYHILYIHILLLYFNYIVPLDYLHIPGFTPGNGLMENKVDDDDDGVLNHCLAA